MNVGLKEQYCMKLKNQASLSYHLHLVLLCRSMWVSILLSSCMYQFDSHNYLILQSLGLQIHTIINFVISLLFPYISKDFLQISLDSHNPLCSFPYFFYLFVCLVTGFEISILLGQYTGRLPHDLLLLDLTVRPGCQDASAPAGLHCLSVYGRCH